MTIIFAFVPWTCCGWVCRVLPWLRGHMSLWEGAGSPSCGGVVFAVVFCLATPALLFGYLQVLYTIIVDSVSLFVVCCICESFGGSWIGVRWLSTT